MKKHLQHTILLGLLVGLLPSCASVFESSDAPPNRNWDHWNVDSIPPRVDRFFLGGYDSDIHGSYADKFSADMAHVRKTCKRIFLNHNEDNPFQ